MTIAGVTGEEWDSHLLLLYRDEADRQDSVALWIQRGLDRGEKILYTLRPDDADPLPGLSQRGVEMPVAVHRGQFTVLPLEDFFPPNGQAALVRRALDEGYPGVRLSTYGDALLNYLSVEEYQVLDQGLDELCQCLPVSALCQYDASRTTTNTLGTVIDSHPEAVRDAQMRLRRCGDLVLAGGEIDAGSAEALARWLRRVCRREHASEEVIDLSELTFVDVAGCRALISATEAFRAQGGVVFLRGLRGHIRKVMILLQIDRLPGVELR